MTNKTTTLSQTLYIVCTTFQSQPVDGESCDQMFGTWYHVLGSCIAMLKALEF